MKLFNFKSKPVETAPPGNDGSKLPIPGSLLPVVEPSFDGIVDLCQDHLDKMGGAGIQREVGPFLLEDFPRRHNDISPNSRLDLNQYRSRVPIERPVTFELGDPIVIEGCKFKIVYIRSNPSRMTLEAV